MEYKVKHIIDEFYHFKSVGDNKGFEKYCESLNIDELLLLNDLGNALTTFCNQRIDSMAKIRNFKIGTVKL